MTVELTKALNEAEPEKVGRWYCDLNCFRTPEGFPVELPASEDPYRDPAWREAWTAVQAQLGEEGCSRAWWLYELGKTEAEWLAWRAAR